MNITDEELQIKIAELCGWRFIDGRYVRKGHPCDVRLPSEMPDYTSDLNAMHEAILVLTEQKKAIYRNILIGLCEGMQNRNWAAIDATARQRAEAFVMAMEAV